MRLCWFSNAPWNNSGYGKQTALFVPRIASLGHEITIVAPHSFGGAPLTWGDFTVLPCRRDIAGNDLILQAHEWTRSDLTVILADPFSLLGSAKELSQVPTATWFPVDADPLGYGDVSFLRESGTVPIAMSLFGRRVLENEGSEPLLVPHGVDPGVYHPAPRTYRDTLPGVTDETFVIGLCAMNRDPVRKGFFEQLAAFARFHARHPDSFMALHSSPGGFKGSLNLHGMACQLGITGAVGFPDSFSYDLGLIGEEAMAAWFNGIDVLSMTSYAEGFGLPLIEAQACGTPVITTDAASMTELCGAGFLVSGTPYWTDGHTSMWVRPDIADIDQAYEAAWHAWQQGTLPHKPAIDFAAQFAVDRVFEEHWVPCLAALEERFG